MATQYAWPFDKPVRFCHVIVIVKFSSKVDAAKLGLTDYFDIVTKPMDLKTIRVRLRFPALRFTLITFSEKAAEE